MTIPLLQGSSVDLTDKDITADALLTQRSIAQYVRSRLAHYHLTVKGNQPKLRADLELHFQSRSATADFEEADKGHGRLEVRRIWVSSDPDLIKYLDFPEIGQVFLIERIITKAGKTTHELAYGITSRPASQVSSERLLQINRGHWSIENRCHYILDEVLGEDRSRIRTGHGPENVSRLRRFAVGLVLSKSDKGVAKTMRAINSTRRVLFDYLLMTDNACLGRLSAAA
jgi:predicted transposase YbfD/YdcC